MVRLGAGASARPRNLYTLVQRALGLGGLNLLLAFNGVCKLYLEGTDRNRRIKREGKKSWKGGEL